MSILRTSLFGRHRFCVVFELLTGCALLCAAPEFSVLLLELDGASGGCVEGYGRSGTFARRLGTSSRAGEHRSLLLTPVCTPRLCPPRPTPLLVKVQVRPFPARLSEARVLESEIFLDTRGAAGLHGLHARSRIPAPSGRAPVATRTLLPGANVTEDRAAGSSEPSPLWAVRSRPLRRCVSFCRARWPLPEPRRRLQAHLRQESQP